MPGWRLLPLLGLLFCRAEAEETEELLLRIAVGSCNNARKQSLWGLVATTSPSALVLLGDNVYADRRDGLSGYLPATPRDIEEQYRLLEADPAFQDLVRGVGGFARVIATWDDHDFGINDGDRRYPWRNESQRLFLDLFRVPSDHPRRRQKGVYTSSVLTAGNLTCKVVLLDTRFNKDPYTRLDGDFLGEEQWRWLETELADERPDLLLLGSSIQVLPEGKLVEESWSRFPASRERLLRLVLEAPVANVLLLSGDIHTSEVLKARCGVGRDRQLIEFTASGLTHTFTESTRDKSRAKGGPMEVVSKGPFKLLVYTVYQWLFPHFYREQAAHHYRGIHFGLVDVVANGVGEKKVVIQTINLEGLPVIRDSFDFHAKGEALSGTCSHTSINASLCEPIWGDIPRWRLWLCVCGLSMIPIISIGGPASIVLLTLYAVYNRFQRKR